jgi:hypothetical protein
MNCTGPCLFLELSTVLYVPLQAQYRTSSGMENILIRRIGKEHNLHNAFVSYSDTYGIRV